MSELIDNIFIAFLYIFAIFLYMSIIVFSIIMAIVVQPWFWLAVIAITLILHL